MQFIDLKTQYQRYQTEIDDRMRRVVDHGRFIMGPEIAAKTPLCFGSVSSQ